MAGVVLPERPEDQPADVVEAMRRLTSLDEQFVRVHLAVMSSADAINAWERIRAHERVTGTSASRPDTMPDDVVAEIAEFSGVDEDVIRRYLSIRHAMDATRALERLTPPSAAEARLLRWRVRLAFDRPLPPWAEALIDELGVQGGQRTLARHLTAATLALVGGGKTETRAWLAEPDPDDGRAPVDIVLQEGWEALDRLLLRAYEREAKP